ncbi:MAG: FecR domain-containing protein [Burkholderiales bacterium]|nr:FecR domain-containing protein [Burkholderiales bacterium]
MPMICARRLFATGIAVNYKYLILLIFLLFPLVMLFAPSAARAQAARVVDVRGTSMVERAGAPLRILGTGEKLDQHDTVSVARDSWAILEFSDRTRVTLRPDTVFRIDAWREGAPESALMGLVKGGLRVVTGFISKRNARAMQVTTAVATMGIRGTEFDARLCEADCAVEERQRPAPRWLPPPVARVIEMDGIVAAARAGQPGRVLVPGAGLREGDGVATGPGAYAVLVFRDGARVTLAQNSRFAINRFRYDEAAPRASGAFLTLLAGDAHVWTGQLAKISPDAFLVRGALGIVRPHGTGFSISGCIGSACGSASVNVGSDGASASASGSAGGASASASGSAGSTGTSGSASATADGNTASASGSAGTGGGGGTLVTPFTSSSMSAGAGGISQSSSGPLGSGTTTVGPDGVSTSGIGGSSSIGVGTGGVSVSTTQNLPGGASVNVGASAGPGGASATINTPVGSVSDSVNVGSDGVTRSSSGPLGSGTTTIGPGGVSTSGTGGSSSFSAGQSGVSVSTSGPLGGAQASAGAGGVRGSVNVDTPVGSASVSGNSQQAVNDVINAAQSVGDAIDKGIDAAAAEAAKLSGYDFTQHAWTPATPSKIPLPYPNLPPHPFGTSTPGGQAAALEGLFSDAKLKADQDAAEAARLAAETKAATEARAAAQKNQVEQKLAQAKTQGQNVQQQAENFVAEAGQRALGALQDFNEVHRQYDITGGVIAVNGPPSIVAPPGLLSTVPGVPTVVTVGDRTITTWVEAVVGGAPTNTGGGAIGGTVTRTEVSGPDGVTTTLVFNVMFVSPMVTVLIPQVGGPLISLGPDKPGLVEVTHRAPDGTVTVSYPGNQDLNSSSVAVLEGEVEVVGRGRVRQGEMLASAVGPVRVPGLADLPAVKVDPDLFKDAGKPVEEGLYVWVRDGAVTMEKGEKTVDVPAGNAAVATKDKLELLDAVPNFMRFDATPRPLQALGDTRVDMFRAPDGAILNMCTVR